MKIKVSTYSGYRSEETPLEFYLHGEKIEIIEILDMRLEENSEHRARKRFFKVKGSDGYTHNIYYDEELLEWFYA